MEHKIDPRAYAEELRSRRVAVFQQDAASWLPIPAALTPTRVTRRHWNDLVKDAHAVISAFPKVMSWLHAAEQATLRAKVLAGLSPLEVEAALCAPSASWGHATLRMDLFWHGEEIKIIEVNCTIPAMQAYSDNVLQAWSAAGGTLGSAAMQSNTNELLQSLRAIYQLDGGVQSSPRIAILHRAGDSQLGELKWYVQEWRRAGVETFLATPDTLLREGGAWRVGGEPIDIVYRHIFAWRLEGHPLSQPLKHNRESHVYNPMSAHYEAKAFLALVSHIASEADLRKLVGLDRREIDAIQRRVPWSRILSLGGATLEALQDRWTKMVFKRSVGYGGHQVIMGDEWHAETVQRRLGALRGKSETTTAAEFFRWAVEDDQSLWIAQERMSGAQRRTPVLTASGLTEWDAWYDASIFLNTRAARICTGGVSRISPSPIVNIGTGGGLAPFLIEEDGSL